MNSIEKQLTDILIQAAKKLNLKKYTINLNTNVLKGDGFLGEFYKTSIRDDEKQVFYYLAVKKAPIEPKRREQNNIEKIYQNEIYFYSEIVPSFKRFEQEYQVEKVFESIPKYITSNNQNLEEIIVFEDITRSGYVLREKDLLLNDEHAKLIFQTYGHYHAISFCLKEKNPDEFNRITRNLKRNWEEFGENDGFMNALQITLNKSYEALDLENFTLVRDKFKKYIENTKEIYMKSCRYKGNYFGILHGDCWSNNMMFKYQDIQNHSKIDSMKLLDFQLVTIGTPVYDLSYFFYTGGCKELFNKLEDYLDIYYKQFSKSCLNFKCDPKKLLPREMLTQDWKQYARFGMLLSTIITKIKLISKEDSIRMVEAVDKENDDKVDKEKGFEGVKYDEELFKTRIRNVLVHMYEIDAL